MTMTTTMMKIDNDHYNDDNDDIKNDDDNDYDNNDYDDADKDDFNGAQRRGAGKSRWFLRKQRWLGSKILLPEPILLQKHRYHHRSRHHSPP